MYSIPIANCSLRRMIWLPPEKVQLVRQSLPFVRWVAAGRLNPLSPTPRHRSTDEMKTAFHQSYFLNKQINRKGELSNVHRHQHAHVQYWPCTRDAAPR